MAKSTPNSAYVAALQGGVRQQTPMAATFLAALLGLHLLGLLDDRKAMGPYVKLVFQLAAAAVLVIPFRQMRILTALGPAISIALTILWIVGITNAFNFLDNMDGMSAGIAAVASTAFLITAILISQWFVAAIAVAFARRPARLPLLQFSTGEHFHG